MYVESIYSIDGYKHRIKCINLFILLYMLWNTVSINAHQRIALVFILKIYEVFTF